VGDYENVHPYTDIFLVGDYENIFTPYIDIFLVGDCENIHPFYGYFPGGELYKYTHLICIFSWWGIIKIYTTLIWIFC